MLNRCAQLGKLTIHCDRGDGAVIDHKHMMPAYLWTEDAPPLLLLSYTNLLEPSDQVCVSKENDRTRETTKKHG